MVEVHIAPHRVRRIYMELLDITWMRDGSPRSGHPRLAVTVAGTHRGASTATVAQVRTVPMQTEMSAEARAAPDQNQYRVVSIPGTDTLFRHTVDRHVRSVRGRGATIRAARRSLRQRYPDAELSCQGDGIVRGESVELWFAYRDGRAEANAPQARWWDERGLARVVVDTSGRLIRPNAACRRLLDMPPGNVGAMTVCDLVSSQLFRELWLESKRLSTTATWDGSLPLRLPSGRRLDIEFHASRDGTAQRFEVALRSVPDRDRANDFIALEQSALGSMSPAFLKELFRGG